MFTKVVLALVCAVAPLAAGASDLPSYPFIHVSADGSARVLPDIGQVDFEISAHDPDPAVAVRVVQGRIDEIRALMSEAGISGDDLQIRDVRKDLRKVEAGSLPGVPLYDIRCGVKVVVRDLSKWKIIVAPLLDKPNLEGFMTMFDTSERNKVEAELMSDAIKVARRKAEGMAAGFGRKLGAVSGVSSGELRNLTRAMRLAPSEFNQRRVGNRAAPDQTELLAIVLLELAQSVDVIYRIK